MTQDATTEPRRGHDAGADSPKGTRLPGQFVWSVVVLCATPSVLQLLGVDFASPNVSNAYEPASFGISDDVYQLLNGAFIHTLLEWSAVMVAVITAGFGFLHYRIKPDLVIPVICIALLCSASMDTHHALAAARLISQTSNLDFMPFTWAVARLFHVAIMCVGIAILLLRGQRDARQGQTDHLGFLLIVSMGFMVLSYLIIHVLETNPWLPQTMFPEAVITRPYDVLPLILFVFAGVFLYRPLYHRHPSYFSHALFVAMIPNIAIGLHMSFGSIALYDAHFNIAHFLKIIAYAVPLAGLCFDQIETYRSERRLHAELVEGTAAQLDAVFRTSTDAIITISDHGTTLSLNPAAEKIFGYSAVEVIGNNINMLMPEPHRGQHVDYLKRYRDSGVPRVIGIGTEVQGRHKDGRLIELDLSISESTIGGKRSFTGILRDISKRKQAERERDRLFDLSVDVLCIATPEGYLKRINPALVKLLGHSKETLLDRPYLEFIHPDDVQATESETERLNSGEITYSFENRYRCADGSYRSLEWTAIPDPDSGLIYAAARDVTLKRELDALVAGSNQRLALRAKLERCTSEVLALFNHRYELESLLDQMLAHLAAALDLRCSTIHLYSDMRNELLLAAEHGAPAELKQQFKPGEGLVGRCAASHEMIVLEAGNPDASMRLQTSDGQVEAAGVILLPIGYGDQTLGVLSVASPVALQKPVRQFLDQLSILAGRAIEHHRQYEQMVALTEKLNERGRQIARQNAELERFNRLKSEFLANMSHELRTPLNAIIGFSEVLKDGLVGELNEQQADYAGEIYGSGHHLLSLVNDILDLSKIEAGKMKLELELIDAHQLFANALSVVKEKAAKGGIQLCSKIEGSPETLFADGRKVRQILYNLLSNAVKFTAEGGSVCLEAKSLLAGDTEYVDISVTDTGIGIASDDRDRLFEPFEQIDGTVGRRFDGTGLGLALSQSLAELHGVSIDVESELGRGSRFTFRLPVRQPDTENSVVAPQADDAEQPNPGAPLVLIIEDDAAASKLLVTSLRKAGYAVDAVTSAEAASDWLKDNQPDLIVLDILLPGRHGMALLEDVKTCPSTAGIPVIIVSVVGDDHRQKGMSLGAADVFQKPVSASAVLSTMDRLGLRPSTGPVQVLVVDDDPTSVEIVAGPLETRGFKVLRAYRGHDALMMARSDRPDVIIMDLVMPEMSGFEVIAALKSDPELAAIPTVVLSGATLDAEERLKLEQSIRGVIDKSTFEPELVLSQVRRALQPLQPVPDRKAEPS